MQAITPTSNSQSISNISHGKSRYSTFSTPTTENHKWFKAGKQLVLKFPLSMLILGQKACFLGPTIFEIPQPN